MKHTLSIIIALLFAPIIAVQADDLTRSISIVPTPVQMVPGEGRKLSGILLNCLPVLPDLHPN